MQLGSLCVKQKAGDEPRQVLINQTLLSIYLLGSKSNAEALLSKLT
jgi:hypothetical protein